VLHREAAASFKAYMLLGSAYLAKGEPLKAIEAFLRLEARPQGPAGALSHRPRASGQREIRGSEE
jgi:hypothetical protein